MPTPATMLTALYIAARIASNPVSNVFQKKLTGHAAHPVFIIAATHALLALPCLLALPFSAAPVRASAFWTNMALCVVLAVSSNVLLVYALQSGDLSVLGPINAYKAVISLGLGVILIGEIPTLAGLAGVLLILAGSYFVLDRSDGTAHDWRGIRFRLAALVLSATEAVFLKRAILAANPVTTFLCWSILGLPVAALAAAILLRGRVLADVARFRRHRSTYAWLAITTGVMQLTTLLTFGTLQVGYALSLFQLSALLSVLLGHRYFQERDLKKRLLGSTIMIAGAILIVVHGRG